MTQANTGSGGPAVTHQTIDSMSWLLAALAATEPVLRDGEYGYWQCGYCERDDSGKVIVARPPDRDQWRRSGRTIVDHAPDCPWLPAARWLDPDAAAGNPEPVS